MDCVWQFRCFKSEYTCKVSISLLVKLCTKAAAAVAAADSAAILTHEVGEREWAFHSTPWAGQLVMNCDGVSTFIVFLFLHLCSFSLGCHSSVLECLAHKLIATITHFRQWFVCYFALRTLNTWNYCCVYLCVLVLVYFISWPYRLSRSVTDPPFHTDHAFQTWLTLTMAIHTHSLSLSYARASHIHTKCDDTHTLRILIVKHKCHRLEWLNLLWTETFATPKYTTIIAHTEYSTQMKIISDSVRPCKIKTNKGNVMKWVLVLLGKYENSSRINAT